MKIRRILLPFSLLYCGIIQLRNFLYNKTIFKSTDFPIPIISVGNISVGGTGKTPMAEFLIEHFLKKNTKASYLSRGYGRKTKGYLQVPTDKYDSFQFGDEALQVANKFPAALVAVCESRVDGAKKLIELGAEIIILDDAFQHRKIDRDLDLIMIDAKKLPFNDFCLPAGNLRELKNAIKKRGDFVVVNKVFNENTIDKIESKIPISAAFTTLEIKKLVHFTNGEEIAASDFTNYMAVAFSGLGNNGSFFKSLEKSGIKITKTRSFSDHYQYSAKDLTKIHELLTNQEQKTIMICSEKDVIRIKSLNLPTKLKNMPLYFTSVSLKWLKGEQKFLEKIKIL